MYDPSLHTATNKPIGLTNKPVDARTYFYDDSTFSYRPYADTAEALAYLNNSIDRVGQFSIIIGTDEYWFKDGTLDADLVAKYGGYSKIDIPAGSTLAGDGYYRVTYAAYLRYGQNPTKWIEYYIDANNQEQKYVVMRNRRVSGVLTYIDVYADPDPSDPTKTADHLLLILK